MKSYQYSKLGLLASLFKFHVLWACVHPTSGLNMDQAAYVEQKICIKSNGLNLKANTQKDKKAKYKHKVNQFTSITKQSSAEDNDNTIDQTICAKCSAITLKFNNKNTKNLTFSLK